MSATPGTPGRTRRRREREPRRAEVKVRLSEQEREQLQSRAAALGVSVPRLLVEAALSGMETPADRRRELGELFEVRRVLATIANNINQLAHQANISGDLPGERRLADALEDVRGVVGELRLITGARR